MTKQRIAELEEAILRQIDRSRELREQIAKLQKKLEKLQKIREKAKEKNR